MIGAALAAWIGLNYVIGAWLIYSRTRERGGRLAAALLWPMIILRPPSS